MPKLGQPLTLYVGLDPGKSGGIAKIFGKEIKLYNLSDKTPADIWRLLKEAQRGSTPIKASLEWIHPAIQGIGKASMSKLYGSFQSLQMALVAAEIPFEIVIPRKWQQAFNIAPRKKTESQGQWKRRLKDKAEQLFPKLDITLATADALLIAEYCRRKDQGKL